MQFPIQGGYIIYIHWHINVSATAVYLEFATWLLFYSNQDLWKHRETMEFGVKNIQTKFSDPTPL